ncbi:Fc.00g045380.m01.CDS01 [Cosmosporella sp. VM-42]
MDDTPDDEDYEYQSDNILDTSSPRVHPTSATGSEFERFEESEESYLLTFCADICDQSLNLEELLPDAELGLHTQGLLHKYDLQWISPLGTGGNSTVYTVPLKAYLEQGREYRGSDPKFIVCRRRQNLLRHSEANHVRIWREFSIEVMLLRNEVLARHANIVNLLSLDFSTRSSASLEPPTFLYEHAELGCLSAFLDRSHRARRRLSRKLMTKLCVDIGNGLEALQSQNVAHLDLKPENVLIMRDNECSEGIGFIAKIADFGCAMVDSASFYVGGTRAWMPPEQLLTPPGTQLKAPTTRFRDVLLWDLYSYGLIVWYISRAGRVRMSSQHLALVTEDAAKNDAMDACLQRVYNSLQDIEWESAEGSENARELVADCIGHLVRYDPRKRDLRRALDCLYGSETRPGNTIRPAGWVHSASKSSDACRRYDMMQGIQGGFLDIYEVNNGHVGRVAVEEFSVFLERLPRRTRVANAALPQLDQWVKDIACAPLKMHRSLFWPEVLLSKMACVQLAFASSGRRDSSEYWIQKAVQIEESIGIPLHLRIAHSLVPEISPVDSPNSWVLPRSLIARKLRYRLSSPSAGCMNSISDCAHIEDALRFDRDRCDGFFTTMTPEYLESIAQAASNLQTEVAETHNVWVDLISKFHTAVGDTLATYAAGSLRLLPLLWGAVEEGSCSPTLPNDMGLSAITIAFRGGNSAAAHYLLDKVVKRGLSAELAESEFLPFLFCLPDEDQQSLFTKAVQCNNLVLNQVYRTVDSFLPLNLFQQAILLKKLWLLAYILDLQKGESMGPQNLEDVVLHGIESCTAIHSAEYLRCFVERWMVIAKKPINYDAIIGIALSQSRLFWKAANGEKFLDKMTLTLSFLIDKRGLDNHQFMVWGWIHKARRFGCTEILPFLYSFLNEETAANDSEQFLVSRFLLWSLEFEDFASADLAVRRLSGTVDGRNNFMAFGSLPSIFYWTIQFFSISSRPRRLKVVRWVLDRGYPLQPRDLPALINWAFTFSGEGGGKQTEQDQDPLSALECPEKSLATLSVDEEESDETLSLPTILHKVLWSAEQLAYVVYDILFMAEPIRPLEAFINAIQTLEQPTLPSILSIPPSATSHRFSGNSFLDLLITDPLISQSVDWKPQVLALFSRHLQRLDIASTLDGSGGLFIMKAVLRSDVALLEALAFQELFRSYIATKQDWVSNAMIELDVSQARWERNMVQHLNAELEGSEFSSHNGLLFPPVVPQREQNELELMKILVSQRSTQTYQAIASNLRRFACDGQYRPADEFLQSLRVLVAALAEMDIRPVILHHCVLGFTLHDAIAANPSLRSVASLSETIFEVLQVVDCRVRDTVPGQFPCIVTHERWSIGAQYTILYLLGSSECKAQVEEVNPTAFDGLSHARLRLTKNCLVTAQMKLQQISTIFHAHLNLFTDDEPLVVPLDLEGRCRYRLLRAMAQYSNCRGGSGIRAPASFNGNDRLKKLLVAVSRCRKMRRLTLDSGEDSPSRNFSKGELAEVEELEEELGVGLTQTEWLNSEELSQTIAAHTENSYGLFLILLLEGAAWFRRLQSILQCEGRASQHGAASLTRQLSKMADLKLQIAHALTTDIQQRFLQSGLRPDPTQLITRFCIRLARRENLFVSMPFHEKTENLPPPGDDSNYLRFLAYHMMGRAADALQHGNSWFESSRQAYRDTFNEGDRPLFDDEMNRKNLGSGRFTGPAALLAEIDPATTQLLCEMAQIKLDVHRRFRDRWTDEDGIQLYAILKGSECDLTIHVLSHLFSEEAVGPQLMSMLDGAPHLDLAGHWAPGSLWARLREVHLEVPSMEERETLGVAVGSTLGLPLDFCVSVDLPERVESI